MNRPLEGQAALVTGGSRGIGRAVAEALAAAGAQVILTSRSAEPARRAAEELSTGGAKVSPLALDVSDPESVSTGVATLLGVYGTIPILVNNAGITRDNLLLRMKAEDWAVVLETNLGGVYRLCRAIVPSMLRARYGRIVNITSVVAWTGNPGQVNYCSAKAGVEGFTRSLAREVASRDITVNSVAPGFVDTDMTRSLDEATRTRLLEQVPMKRLGRPEDVAAAVTFLVGPGASYITGATLHVNGGMYM